jgi:hypothetical protein
MKKILVIILMTLMFYSVKAQVGAAVVTDPGATSLLSTMQATLTATETTNSLMAAKIGAMELRDYARMGADFLTTVETLKKIQELLNNLVCQMEEMQINISLMDQENCIIKLDFNMTLVNISYSTELIKIGLVAGNLFFTTGERMSTLENVRKSLENSIKDMARFNVLIRFSVSDYLTRNYSRRSSYSMKKSFGASRY